MWRVNEVLSYIFNSFPYTAYSQNVGLVSLSGAKKNNVIYGMVVLLLYMWLYT